MQPDVTKLSWADRFKICNALNVTDDRVICRAFNIVSEELDAAREVASKGFIDVKTAKADPQTYKDLIMTVSTIVSTEPKMENNNIGADKLKAKTGPKTSKIHSAFYHVPTEPTSADAYASKFGVSVAVLRQHARFDTTGLPGKVQVRKDKTSKALMLWREVL